MTTMAEPDTSPTALARLRERLDAWRALVNENASSSVFVSDGFRAEQREKGVLLSEASAAIRALREKE